MLDHVGNWTCIGRVIRVFFVNKSCNGKKSADMKKQTSFLEERYQKINVKTLQKKFSCVILLL